MLNEYFKGVKTGTTPSAGPCLTGYFVRREFSIIVCILNSKNSEIRFRDMAILVLWALDKHLQGLSAKDAVTTVATNNLNYYNNWVSSAAIKKS